MLQRTIPGEVLSSSSVITNPLVKKLEAALYYVNATCVLGSSNKSTDMLRTGEWAIFCGYYFRPPLFQKINNKWKTSKCKTEDSYLKNGLITKNKSADPLMDPEFQLSKSHRRLLVEAIYTQLQRTGLCFEKSVLLAKYLWENSELINRIEVVSASNFDHVFVIINRSGILEKPETWGDTYIVDPWSYENGIIYHASEFKNKIKEIKQYHALEAQACNNVIDDEENSSIEEDTFCKISFEIDTTKHFYPTYSLKPFLPVEYYYDMSMDFPYDSDNQSMFFSLSKHLKLHKEKFSACADEITNFDRKSYRVKS